MNPQNLILFKVPNTGLSVLKIDTRFSPAIRLHPFLKAVHILLNISICGFKRCPIVHGFVFGSGNFVKPNAERRCCVLFRSDIVFIPQSRFTSTMILANTFIFSSLLSANLSTGTGIRSVIVKLCPFGNSVSVSTTISSNPFFHDLINICHYIDQFRGRCKDVSNPGNFTFPKPESLLSRLNLDSSFHEIF